MFAPKRPLHRIAAGTEAARKFQSAHQKIPEEALTSAEVKAEIKAWNARIDAQKRAKS